MSTQSVIYTKQLTERSDKLGIQVVTDRDDYSYTENKAILVTTIFALVNGHSVFGMRQTNNYPIGSILMDDVHVCLDTITTQFSIKVPSDHILYKEIIGLFAEQWKAYNSSSYINIVENCDPAKNAIIPFWMWQEKQTDIYKLLSKYNNDEEQNHCIYFNFPLLDESLSTCDCFVTSRCIEIVPEGIAISKIESFTNAQRRIFKFMPKEMKLGDAFKAWLDAVYEGEKTSAFGVVKTDKGSHAMFGNMAYTNYQLMNTLNINREQMKEALEQSLDFYKMLLDDPIYLRYYINMTSQYAQIDDEEELSLDTYRRDVVLDMTVRTPLFQYTDFYKNFRSDTLKHYKRRLKKGRIAVTGNYQTIFGNPYEFLTATITKKYEPTEPLLLKNNEVHSQRFPHNQVMLGARSPHITMGNLFAVRNVLQPKLVEYFNLTENIICVNAIGDNIQQRLNGCDYDSDSMLVTNNPGLIQHGLADIYYALSVPVCKVDPSGKTDYKNTPKDIARLDRIIGNNKID